MEELLGWQPEGEGEHWMLQITKQGLNTEFVAKQLARALRIPSRQVSYSGLKDRHAVTSQWFGIHLPGHKGLDWPGIIESINDNLQRDHADESLQLNQAVAHRKKLKTGSHRGNRFRLRLQQVTGDREEWDQTLQLIARQGVPHYFGPQRFGHSGANWERLLQWVTKQWRPKRHQKGLYLSVLRAFLFNELLSYRVGNQTWNQALEGDLMMLAGSRSLFSAREEELASLQPRAAVGEISATGFLAGADNPKLPPLSGEPWMCEQALQLSYSRLCTFAKQQKLIADRRALCLPVGELNWHWHASDILELSFILPKGGFATSVLHECGELRESDRYAPGKRQDS